MKLTCQHIDGATLKGKWLETGWSNSSIFDMSKDTEYRVFGVKVVDAGILFLVCDDNNLPNWYPAEAFYTNENQEVPPNWRIGCSDSRGVTAKIIMGYPELVENPYHHDAILLRNREHLEFFRSLGKEC
jgi:hypothetical protein